MQAKNLAGDIEARFAIRKVILYGFAGSLVLNVLLAAKLLVTEYSYRIEVKVPPSISKSFWLDERSLSPEYIESMGWYVLQLAVNASPIGAERQVRELLKFVAPSSYGELEKTLLANAARLRENNASTTFFPTEISVNQADNSVAFRGLLSTWIGDKRTSQTSKAFVVRFGYAGGRVFLRELKESEARDPLKEGGDAAK